eukprot:606564-Rhodomonas_salina.2
MAYARAIKCAVLTPRVMLPGAVLNRVVFDSIEPNPSRNKVASRAPTRRCPILTWGVSPYALAMRCPVLTSDIAQDVDASLPADKVASLPSSYAKSGIDIHSPVLCDVRYCHTMCRPVRRLIPSSTREI